MPRWTHPNWCQRLIADNVGLQGQSIAIGNDNDSMILILAHKSGTEYVVNKKTGDVKETKRGGTLTG